jgi:tRNA(Arg) A34 adenosine deaminase TadA
MTNTQLNIVSKLISLAETSKLNRKHAAAICQGRKIIYKAVNTNRSKFNRHYSVCGHSEMHCIHAFAKQRRRQYV